MRLITLAALALLITPASAQTEQLCLSKTIGGKDIETGERARPARAAQGSAIQL